MKDAQSLTWWQGYFSAQVEGVWQWRTHTRWQRSLARCYGTRVILMWSAIEALLGEAWTRGSEGWAQICPGESAKQWGEGGGIQGSWLVHGLRKTENWTRWETLTTECSYDKTQGQELQAQGRTQASLLPQHPQTTAHGKSEPRVTLAINERRDLESVAYSFGAIVSGTFF